MSEKGLLTASRISKLLMCPRAHFYRYEIGLQSESEALALRFGTAWHNAMEARWTGAPYEAALEAAIPEEGKLDELAIATIAALLSAYYHVNASDPVKEIHPEVEFRHTIDGSRSFDAAGKLDGLGVMHDGRQCLVEHKTTAEEITPDSDYGQRLRHNIQILQYVLASRVLGWDVSLIIYDVTRKPAIRPKMIPTLDEAGCKIVVGPDGARVFKKDGSPRESGDTEKGYVIQSTLETAEQFGTRLASDAAERPDFYFARREVPVLEQDLEEFICQRSELGKLILAFRQAEKRTAKRQQAWPRNVGIWTCRNCDFAGFCLQGVEVTETEIPAGFRLGPIHAELEGVL
jgi:hypothetical protein